MNITRRELLTLAGGSVLGTLFTPIPWKLLDDSAIWTQNWSRIPALRHGPVSYRLSACPLCPGGCALNVRCVQGRPVSLGAVPEHPVSNGVICATAYAGHHLATHPLRLHQPYAFNGKTGESTLLPMNEADIASRLGGQVRNIAQSPSDGVIAILDQRPGRAISAFYQEFLAGFPGSHYVVAPGADDPTLSALSALCDFKDLVPSYDFENARTILSFGAPLLDGWGTPGRMYAALHNRAQKGRTLIQAEGVHSRTALQADTWLPLMAGTEAAFALAVGHVIIQEGRYPALVARHVRNFPEYAELTRAFAPERVAQVCGLSAEQIIATARAIASGPSIVISGGNPAGGPFDTGTETAIAALNVLSGNVGCSGGVLLRAAVPAPVHAPKPAVSLATIPDHSIKVLILDAAASGNTYPLALLTRKLVRQDAVVVQFSAFLSSQSGAADFILPVPAPFESLEEVQSPAGADRAFFALSSPFMSASDKAVDPVAFLSRVATAAGLAIPQAASTEVLLKQRSEAIFASHRGVVTGPAGTRMQMKDTVSADDVWKALTDGGYWIDDSTRQPASIPSALPAAISAGQQAALSGTPSLPEGTFRLMPFGWRGATMTAAVAPVMSKLFQESNLRALGGRLHINPATAAACGLADGESARITTAAGTLTMPVVVDASVMPGLLHAAVGPVPNKTATATRPESEGILALCSLQDDGSWRFTEASMGKA